MLRMFIRSMTTAPKSKKPPVPVFGLEGRYVTALYSAASQMNQLDQVEKNLRDLQKVLKKPKVVDFMETSLISRTGKSKLMIAIAKEAAQSPYKVVDVLYEVQAVAASNALDMLSGLASASTNFLGLVAENGRLKQLGRMIRMFLAVMVAHRNEALCEVITADPLDDATRKTLVDILKRFVQKGKNIQLREIVAADALGGVVIGFEDKHIDMTILKRITLYRGRIKYYIKYQ